MADARAYIRALRNSHDDLSGLLDRWVDSALLQGPSYDRQWTIAQVLSHLGSGAEIFSLLVDTASEATDPPSHEALRERWAAWDAKAPQGQADDFVAADRHLIERLEGLTDAELAGLHLEMFGRELDAAGLLHLRLSEHALHRWDVTVMYHDRAELLDDAVALLVDGLGDFALRVGKPLEESAELTVRTADPARVFGFTLGPQLAVTDAPARAAAPVLELTAAELIRLVAGRLDPAHLFSINSEGRELERARQVFTGF
ncbi:MAG: maleylpyruvate isomerase N-terminal domain-containing protein [Actinomycetota bacterium]|nr:maleylpyruvate isomerase N-terminal domain-containing protein [Actinomycetota bacterium]